MKTSNNRIKSVLKVRNGLNPQAIQATDKKNYVVLHRSLRPSNFETSGMGECMRSLMVASGGKPKVTFARKGVARLGIRVGAMSGAYVTLRRIQVRESAISANIVNQVFYVNNE